MSDGSVRVPVHLPGTINTAFKGDRKYETGLDVATDLVALREGELDHHETVLLVDYLATAIYNMRENNVGTQ